MSSSITSTWHITFNLLTTLLPFPRRPTPRVKEQFAPIGQIKGSRKACSSLTISAISSRDFGLQSCNYTKSSTSYKIVRPEKLLPLDDATDRRGSSERPTNQLLLCDEEATCTIGIRPSTSKAQLDDTTMTKHLKNASNSLSTRRPFDTHFTNEFCNQRNGCCLFSLPHQLMMFGEYISRATTRGSSSPFLLRYWDFHYSIHQWMILCFSNFEVITQLTLIKFPNKD